MTRGQKELEAWVGRRVVGKRLQTERLSQSKGCLREHDIFTGRQLVPLLERAGLGIKRGPGAGGRKRSEGQKPDHGGPHILCRGVLVFISEAAVGGSSERLSRGRVGTGRGPREVLGRSLWTLTGGDGVVRGDGTEERLGINGEK